MDKRWYSGRQERSSRDSRQREREEVRNMLLKYPNLYTHNMYIYS